MTTYVFRTNYDLIKDGDSLVSACYKSSGTPIQTYDDGFGNIYISRNSIGIYGIVRAQTWEDAYSICEDEFFPEADETIEEIVKETHSLATRLFQERFGFRPNGANNRDTLNHGIYAKDLNRDSLDELTAEMLVDLGIELVIARGPFSRYYL
jgi:hypothetical protein